MKRGDTVFPTITLIGSTKYMDEIREEAVRLTLAGYVVLAPFVVSSEQVLDTDPRVKSMLVHMHLRKIDMAEFVHVVNPGGYIGEHTQFEIDYAGHRMKALSYLVKPGSEEDQTVPLDEGHPMLHAVADPPEVNR